MVGAQLNGDGRYHRVGNLPFVDGVFIPSGAGPVQLDSAGHTFCRFPYRQQLHVELYLGGRSMAGQQHRRQE